MSESAPTIEAVDRTTVDQVIAEARLNRTHVANLVELMQAGATVPFIARYRKERTGGMDEVKIRELRDRIEELEELRKRKQFVLATIEQQGKLTADLKEQIARCAEQRTLEDLYLPYKTKRQTRGKKAEEKGLAPLADRLRLAILSGDDPQRLAAAFVSAANGVASVDEALAGASDILAERLADDAQFRAVVREELEKNGVMASRVKDEKAAAAQKFRDYFDHREAVARIPSHRVLAMRRGEHDRQLSISIDVPQKDRLVDRLRRLYLGQARGKAATLLEATVKDALDRLILPSLANEVRRRLEQKADQEAIGIFAKNLHDLLMAPPLGGKPVLGLDPGVRTGVKWAAVDATGRFLEGGVLQLEGEAAKAAAETELVRILTQHQLGWISIGDGTASRETAAFVHDVVRKHPQLGANEVVVSEAGASIYSASDVAREEFPDLDLTIRSAISIGRRLQDPLAELVKTEPRSIGVGQYQHDVHQPSLKKALSEVVESCVNAVGVDVNTASASLLAYVSGIGPAIAKNIVALRNERGPFARRSMLLEVGKLGARAFEQAAGFLRIRDGADPLDNTGVHPERYDVVRAMADSIGVAPRDLAARGDLLDRIQLDQFVTGEVGLPTLHDILDELRKPGRDPRQTFRAVQYDENVRELGDLKPGAVLEGKVTNVTRFGAFVDVGVHQDGLVHISELADRYVKDPMDVVSVGQIVKATVLSVDLERKRIALSLRQKPRPAAAAPLRGADPRARRGNAGGESRASSHD
ncbi:MAG: Tex family protein [Planctomycetota bacterium]